MIHILKYELKKIFQNKFFIGSIIIALLVLFGMFYIFFFQTQLSGNRQTGQISGLDAVKKNEQIANTYAGTLSDAKIRTIISDYADEIQKEERKEFFDVFSWYTADTFLAEKSGFYEEINEAKKQGNKLEISHIKLRSVESMGFTAPIEEYRIGNFKPWNQLFTLMNHSFMLIALFVILICSTLFSNDFSQNIAPLLSSTRYGRGKLTVAKLTAGFFVAMTAFIVVVGLTLAVFGFYFGFSGWDVSLQTNFIWKFFDFPIVLNNFQTLLVIIGVQCTGLLAVTGVTCFVSSATRTSFTSLALAAGLFLVPQLLTNMFKTGLSSKLLFFSPTNNCNAEKLFSTLGSKEHFFFNTFTGNLTFLLLILFLITLYSNSVTYLRMRYLDIP